jgi:hypothetical protein
LTERIADLHVEHAAPAGRTRSRPVLFVHGMWGGSWYLLMLEDGLERPFKDALGWMERMAP